MVKILLSGAGGRLGGCIISGAKEQPELKIVAGVDPTVPDSLGFPVVAKPSDFDGEADVIIDCSHVSALDGVLEYAISHHTPAVLLTTGYTDEQMHKVREASESVAIFRSANMSLGIAILSKLASEAAAILGSNFDVEIIERHHRKKLDAPSGTALALADAIRRSLDHPAEYVYDRHERRRERPRDEIGISAVRGGTIVGDHEIIFAGNDEVIELRHSAASRMVFAEGALRAAAFLAGKAPGMYNMDMLVGEILGK